MFFGLMNSPTTFQSMMNDIFKELIDEGIVTIYMDDILIFGGQTKEQHHEVVVQVLDILCKHHLYLKAEKCTFEQPMVEYLGLILLEGHVEMDPVKNGFSDLTKEQVSRDWQGKDVTNYHQ